MGIFTIALVVGVTVAEQFATSAAVRELRRHLEREGWESLQGLRSWVGGSAVQGTWQGREAVARYFPATKYSVPYIEIEVATRHPEPMQISRSLPSGPLAFLKLELDLPPKVKLVDERFNAYSRSAETIYEILRDEATSSQLNRFLRYPEDRIESKRGALRVKRSLWKGPKPRFAVILRATAEELTSSVALAHSLFRSLATRGF